MEELAVAILDDVLNRAPSSLVVTITQGVPATAVQVLIDNYRVATLTTDAEGCVAPTSVSVPVVVGQKGTHTLTVAQNGATAASATFTIQNDPATAPRSIPIDAQPVEVPGTVINGVRHWVLQDLLPGGLGSYIFPVNPSSPSSTPVQRELQTVHSVHHAGKFHVFEGSYRPIEWQIQGYCPTQAMHDELRAYAELGRRLYIIDHRNQAWKVAIIDAAFVPRLRRPGLDRVPTDWHFDYTLTVLKLEADPQEPQ